MINMFNLFVHTLRQYCLPAWVVSGDSEMLFRKVSSDCYENHTKLDLAKMQFSRTKYMVRIVTTVFGIIHSWQKVKL